MASAILEHVQDGIFVVNRDNQVSVWTESAERLFQVPAGQALGQPFGAILPFVMAGSSEADLLAAIRGGRPWRDEGSVTRPDGSAMWIESTVSPLDLLDGSLGGVAISRDMTKAHAEARARQAAERALRALSSLNQELVRPSTEPALLDAACRVLVQVAGYRLAWIGYVQDDRKQTLLPMASAGLDDGYVAAARITGMDGPRGRGPSGLAIRSGRPQVLRDPTDPAFARWRREARRRGFTATAAFPLCAEERVLGVMNLYSDLPEAFGDAEVALMTEVANDLAYGINARRAEVERDHGARALRAAEERSRTITDALAEGVVAQDERGAIVSANPAARQIMGWGQATPAETLDWPPELSREDGSPLGVQQHPALVTLRSGRPQRNIVLRLRGVHGETHWVAMNSAPLEVVGGRGVVTSFEDVTLHRRARADERFASGLRAALSEAVRGVPPDASLGSAAQTICNRLSGLDGVDLVGVGLFLAEDALEVVATSAPPGFPAADVLPFPAQTARYLRERAEQGPWAEYVTELAGLSGWEAVHLDPQLAAIAVGPIAHGGHLDGVLVVGTQDPEFASILVSRMPAVDAFSATASGLLVDRLHARREGLERRRRIEQLIADRAFRTVFQPIIDLESQEPAGYEALTRFTSGQAPDECFAEAWSVGLGADLEMATLIAAIESSANLPGGHWLDLNISPRLLLETERVGAILANVDRPVVLEITEHESVADYEALRRAVRRLGDDVRVAIDDAGSGVANFGHIIELRPDFVKLDRSLVQRVNAHLGRQALVVAMRHFARTAGCRLVAEGIETEAEAAALHHLGVEFGQGYLFGRPDEAPRPDRPARPRRRGRSAS